MKSHVVSALLVALSTSFAVPAFASGYGPAPFYRPSVGAPASQRGQSAQTVAAERNQANIQLNGASGEVLARQMRASHPAVVVQNETD